MINEGRSLAHASKDHVVKVANEADFILNRMRADDVRKASEFDQLANQTTLERIEEENLCNHFIEASCQRYLTLALRLEEKYLWLMMNKKEDYFNRMSLGWKLDPWEDDLRRRRRLTRNSSAIEYHSDDFVQSNSNMKLIDTTNQEEFLLKQSRLQQQQKNSTYLSSNHQDEEDMSQVDEKELEPDLSVPIRYSTPCSLICGVHGIQGTLAITHTSMLFNANDDPIDQKSLPYLENIHGKWPFTEIRAIFSRRYLLQDRALEIFVSNRSKQIFDDGQIISIDRLTFLASVMLAFSDRNLVKKVVNYLPRVGVGGRYGLPQQR